MLWCGDHARGWPECVLHHDGPPFPAAARQPEQTVGPQPGNLSSTLVRHICFLPSPAHIHTHITLTLPSTGRPTRYTYLGAMAGGPRGEPRFIGVTKYDLSKVRSQLLFHLRTARGCQAGAIGLQTARPGTITLPATPLTCVTTGERQCQRSGGAGAARRAALRRRGRVCAQAGGWLAGHMWCPFMQAGVLAAGCRLEAAADCSWSMSPHGKHPLLSPA